jgi:hypothetical protein
VFGLIKHQPDLLLRFLWPGLPVAGFGGIYVTLFYVLLALSMAPLLDSVLLLGRWSKRIKIMGLTGFLTTIVIGFALYLLWEPLVRLMDYLQMYLLVGFGIAYAIAGWIVLRKVIVKARFMSKDRRYFKIATQSTSLTRETIATDFAGFRSNWYRV